MWHLPWLDAGCMPVSGNGMRQGIVRVVFEECENELIKKPVLVVNDEGIPGDNRACQQGCFMMYAVGRNRCGTNSGGSDGLRAYESVAS